VPKVSAAFPIRPRLLVYGAIDRIYGQLCVSAPQWVRGRAILELRMEMGRCYVAFVWSSASAIWRRLLLQHAFLLSFTREEHYGSIIRSSYCFTLDGQS